MDDDLGQHDLRSSVTVVVASDRSKHHGRLRCVDVCFKSKTLRARSKAYRADHLVAATEASRQALFHDAGEPLVEACAAGASALLVAYGQAGTGKQSAMEGDATREPQGLAPKLIRGWFDKIGPMLASGAANAMFSLVEITPEAVFDLLGGGHSTTQWCEVPVHSSGQVIELYWTGVAQRRRARLSHSRRNVSLSHLVLQLRVKRALGDPIVLAIADLAEGISGVARQEHTRFVRHSLLSLGKVIFELRAKGRSHVPYRDCKLTTVLKGALANLGAVSVLATVSQELKDCKQTLSTLEFCSQARGMAPRELPPSGKDYMVMADEEVKESSDAEPEDAPRRHRARVGSAARQQHPSQRSPRRNTVPAGAGLSLTTVAIGDLLGQGSEDTRTETYQSTHGDGDDDGHAKARMIRRLAHESIDKSETIKKLIMENHSWAEKQQGAAAEQKAKDELIAKLCDQLDKLQTDVEAKADTIESLAEQLGQQQTASAFQQHDHYVQEEQVRKLQRAFAEKEATCRRLALRLVHHELMQRAPAPPAPSPLRPPPPPPVAETLVGVRTRFQSVLSELQVHRARHEAATACDRADALEAQVLRKAAEVSKLEHELSAARREITRTQNASAQAIAELHRSIQDTKESHASAQSLSAGLETLLGETRAKLRATKMQLDASQAQLGQVRLEHSEFAARSERDLAEAHAELAARDSRIKALELVQRATAALAEQTDAREPRPSPPPPVPPKLHKKGLEVNVEVERKQAHDSLPSMPLPAVLQHNVQEDEDKPALGPTASSKLGNDELEADSKTILPPPIPPKAKEVIDLPPVPPKSPQHYDEALEKEAKAELEEEELELDDKELELDDEELELDDDDEEPEGKKQSREETQDEEEAELEEAKAAESEDLKATKVEAAVTKHKEEEVERKEERCRLLPLPLVPPKSPQYYSEDEEEAHNWEKPAKSSALPTRVHAPPRAVLLLEMQLKLCLERETRAQNALTECEDARNLLATQMAAFKAREKAYLERLNTLEKERSESKRDFERQRQDAIALALGRNHHEELLAQHSKLLEHVKALEEQIEGKDAILALNAAATDADDLLRTLIGRVEALEESLQRKDEMLRDAVAGGNEDGKRALSESIVALQTELRSNEAKISSALALATEQSQSALAQRLQSLEARLLTAAGTAQAHAITGRIEALEEALHSKNTQIAEVVADEGAAQRQFIAESIEALEAQIQSRPPPPPPTDESRAILDRIEVMQNTLHESGSELGAKLARSIGAQNDEIGQRLEALEAKLGASSSLSAGQDGVARLEAVVQEAGDRVSASVSKEGEQQRRLLAEQLATLQAQVQSRPPPPLPTNESRQILERIDELRACLQGQQSDARESDKRATEAREAPPAPSLESQVILSRVETLQASLSQLDSQLSATLAEGMEEHKRQVFERVKVLEGHLTSHHQIVPLEDTRELLQRVEALQASLTDKDERITASLTDGLNEQKRMLSSWLEEMEAQLKSRPPPTPPSDEGRQILARIQDLQACLQQQQQQQQQLQQKVESDAGERRAPPPSMIEGRIILERVDALHEALSEKDAERTATLASRMDEHRTQLFERMQALGTELKGQLIDATSPLGEVREIMIRIEILQASMKDKDEQLTASLAKELDEQKNVLSERLEALEAQIRTRPPPPPPTDEGKEILERIEDLRAFLKEGHSQQQQQQQQQLDSGAAKRQPPPPPTAEGRVILERVDALQAALREKDVEQSCALAASLEGHKRDLAERMQALESELKKQQQPTNVPLEETRQILARIETLQASIDDKDANLTMAIANELDDQKRMLSERLEIFGAEIRNKSPPTSPAPTEEGREILERISSLQERLEQQSPDLAESVAGGLQEHIQGLVERMQALEEQFELRRLADQGSRDDVVEKLGALLHDQDTGLGASLGRELEGHKRVLLQRMEALETSLQTSTVQQDGAHENALLERVQAMEALLVDKDASLKAALAESSEEHKRLVLVEMRALATQLEERDANLAGSIVECASQPAQTILERVASLEALLKDQGSRLADSHERREEELLSQNRALVEHAGTLETQLADAPRQATAALARLEDQLALLREKLEAHAEDGGAKALDALVRVEEALASHGQTLAAVHKLQQTEVERQQRQQQEEEEAQHEGRSGQAGSSEPCAGCVSAAAEMERLAARAHSNTVLKRSLESLFSALDTQLVHMSSSLGRSIADVKETTQAALRQQRAAPLPSVLAPGGLVSPEANLLRSCLEK